MPANLIFSKNDNVADDDIHCVAQARIAIQLCDLHASNKSTSFSRTCYISSTFSTRYSACKTDVYASNKRVGPRRDGPRRALAASGAAAGELA